MVRYGPAARRQALRLFKKGWGYKKIADIIECYPSTVRQWVVAAGLSKRPGPSHSKSKKRAALILYKGNPKMSVVEAAFHMGVNSGTLARWLRSAGIPLHPQQSVRRLFDHEAIRKDLANGMKGAEVAMKYSCSESLVSRIRGGLFEEKG